MARILKKILILFFYFYFSNLVAFENKILVKVNNKVVTSYDLKNKILSTLVLSNQVINQQNIDGSKSLALKSLIESKIKEIEINKYKVKVTDIELNNSLIQISNNELDNFKRQFANNNINYEIYKSDLKIEIAWRKLIYSLYNKKVEISDSEINSELKQILLQGKKDNTEFKLTELLISYENIKERDKKIREINQQINTIGFDNVLKQYNVSLNKSDLGDLGWVNAQSLSKNILTAIKDLKINEISKPIILGNNILFLKLKDKRSSASNLDKETIKKNLIEKKKNQRFLLYSNSHLSKIKNLAVIEYK